MRLPTITTAMLAALSLLAAGPAVAQSTADQPASGTAGGMTPSGQVPADTSSASLREYARVWRQIEDDSTKDQLRTALESGGDLTGHEQELSTALATAGSSMTVEEFERVHRAVQTDPVLQARVQQEAGASRSGAQGELAAPGKGAPLPSGTLGTGPASVQGGTPPGTQQPGTAPGPIVPSGSQDSAGTSGSAGSTPK